MILLATRILRRHWACIGIQPQCQRHAAASGNLLHHEDLIPNRLDRILRRVPILSGVPKKKRRFTWSPSAHSFFNSFVASRYHKSYGAIHTRVAKNPPPNCHNPAPLPCRIAAWGLLHVGGLSQHGGGLSQPGGGLSQPGADYPSLMVDYRCLRAGYRSMAVDYRSMGVDYRSLWVDYRSMGVDYRSTGADYRSMRVDYRSRGPGLQGD